MAYDVLLKTVTTVAVVFLGLAGYQLQSRSAETRETLDRQEAQERKYVPKLQSLIEFDVALERAIEIMRTRKYLDMSVRNRVRRAVGTNLRYTAFKLFLPDYPDRDVIVDIRFPERDIGTMQVRGRMPLRAASLMLGELLWLQPEFEKLRGSAQYSRMQIQISDDGRTLSVSHGDEDIAYSIGPDSLKAWKAWLKCDTHPLAKVADAPFLWLADDLRFAVAREIHNTLMRRPEIAEKYVRVRTDVLAQSSVVRYTVPDDILNPQPVSGFQ